MLAGDVLATYAAGALTITGDGEGNGVELVPGDNPGEYRVIGTVVNGLPTIVNGDTFINDPVTSVTVDLATGSDTFVIRGADATNKLAVTGPVTITDPTGQNTFSLINTRVSGALSVIGGIDEDNLTIDASTIIGDTSFVGGEGNNTLMVVNNSILDGNLDVINGASADSVFVFAAEIDGDVTIDNGAGDDKVVFGMNTQPIIGGSIDISQGDGNDRVSLHETDVKETVTIDNGDGHNNVSIEMSDIGVSIAGTVLEITNGVGLDTLSITDSLITDDVIINNGTGTFGSDTSIVTGDIRGSLTLSSDEGVDNVNITDTSIINLVDFDLGDGESFVAFLRSDLGDDLEIDGGDHRDEVLFEETTVEDDVTINLLGGKDTLSVIAGSRLKGISTLAAGDHPDDTFIRELTPGLVDIAFMALETFEIDEFILN
ncbi:hypothetical protein Pla52n_36170 [Stieleria varia]|uniref:Uncharacterized protein n=2 Tax=Stieleria varia TaxID=2528005 RepID=A0A5C6AT10_9BACT|nr:hypothetical protein Pla52n_36170 [Stieleria varia]